MRIEIATLDPEDADVAAQAFAINQQAFNSPADAGPRWIASLAHSICVGAFSGGRLVGFARIRPYAQWYGGRAVPMAGIASVAVAPAHRGKGLAGRLTTALLPLARDAGLPLSVLYPASTALYRRLGWELAGHLYWLRVPARSLRAIHKPSGVELRPAVEEDGDAVARCYEALCRESNGLLDRTGPSFDPPGSLARDGSLTVAVEDHVVTGYLVARLQPGNGHQLGLKCWDAVSVTPHAAQALWWTLGSYASVVDTVDVRTTPDAGLLLHLPEPDVEVADHQRWMARIVDLEGAVAARGWPSSVSMAVDLDLVDVDAEWQAGRWQLRVSDGRAVLERGGSGTVVLGPGALAALYSAYADPWTLRRAGLLSCGDETALRALSSAFAGPLPHMLDYF